MSGRRRLGTTTNPNWRRSSVDQAEASKREGWTTTATNPTIHDNKSDRGRRISRQTPCNQHLLAAGDGRFTREKSLVRTQPCPIRSTCNQALFAIAQTARVAGEVSHYSRFTRPAPSAVDCSGKCCCSRRARRTTLGRSCSAPPRDSFCRYRMRTPPPVPRRLLLVVRTSSATLAVPTVPQPMAEQEATVRS
jgi:hypothetical protein